MRWKNLIHRISLQFLKIHREIHRNSYKNSPQYVTDGEVKDKVGRQEVGEMFEPL